MGLQQAVLSGIIFHIMGVLIFSNFNCEDVDYGAKKSILENDFTQALGGCIMLNSFLIDSPMRL